MKVYNGIMIVLATIIFVALGACLIFIGAGIISPELIDSFFHEYNYIVLISGLVLVLMSIFEIYFGMKNLHKMPSVAFDNPLGQVKISYDALEDYIKSLSTEISEIKDVKPQILAGRDGLYVHARLIVEKDVNIPEVTSRFQDLVSRYVKDVMGIESISAVRVYIQKISTKSARSYKEEVE